jgi:hypothetical protein
MANFLPDNLRQQSKDLLAKAAETADVSEKRKLISSAFQLAQQAEAAARIIQDGDKG